MADTKISALVALTGAGTDTAADVLPIVDDSTTTTKKILIDELAIAMGTTLATQAQMETATSAVTTVRPSNQHFHPGMPKAWGKVTPPTTVDASYPSAGVSVSKTSTGIYVVTHGRTFSSSNYAVNVIAWDSSGNAISAQITANAATTFTVTFYKDDYLGAVSVVVDPNIAFSYACFGDL